MKKIYIILIASIFTVSTLGCGLVSGKGDAQEVAELFLQDRITSGGFAGDDKYYSDIFRQTTDEKKWVNINQLVDKALGDLYSYSLKTWNTQSVVHTNQLSGTFVVLVYETEYEKGMGQETLTMHKELRGEDFLILGHRVNSQKIQDLIDEGIERVAGE